VIMLFVRECSGHSHSFRSKISCGEEGNNSFRVSIIADLAGITTLQNIADTSFRLRNSSQPTSLLNKTPRKQKGKKKSKQKSISLLAGSKLHIK